MNQVIKICNVYGSKETWSENATNVSYSWPTRLLSTYGTSFYQFLSNAYIWLKLGSYINVMQNFKQSDNDIQIWMTESDNIIEKVRFSDVSS